MDAKFSPKVKKILGFSKEEAIRLGTDFIGTEHLFLGILREGKGLAIEIMEYLGTDIKKVRREIEKNIRRKDVVISENRDNIPLKKSAERVLKIVYLEARRLNQSEINSAHILLAIIRNENEMVTEILSKNKLNYDAVKDFMSNPQASSNIEHDSPERKDKEGSDDSKKQKSQNKAETPVLDNFGIDITQAAIENRLDPIVGRDIEIERLAQILCRRKKNNPVLIGEPGVGKSAIAEGLAIRIIKKKVSRILFGKRVITLDLASIVAGTKYRGQFEERMKAILNELSKTSNIILFIDEIHTIVGAGGASGSLDAANMLKPALARGEIQCIGATTLNEYRQYIEKDGALERRFQKIIVEPTSRDESIEILQNIKDRYEDHHNVIYTDEALKACVDLTMRYVSDRHLPDKAIDALDEAGSRVHITNVNVPKKLEELEKHIEQVKIDKIAAVKKQNFELAASFRDQEKDSIAELDREKENWKEELSKNKETVDEEKIAEVIAMMTGVPVQRIAQAEGSRLLKMDDEIKSEVIGQNEAISKITKAIQRNRAGLKDPNKPIGTFVFLGPTGVGKTHLAKILSQYLFDSKDSLIRIDMSEYMEKFSVSRLVGAPPGYIGYEEGGQLTEKIRRKPYSIVLLDEIEKAHPDVFHLLLQVLDEGQLTDSLGRKVDFKNTIIIMTSNIGSRELKDFGRGVGYAFKTDEPDDVHAKSVIQKALKKAFAPEFLNRIDDVIIFNSLERKHIHQIIDIELKGLFDRIEMLGYKMKISPAAKDFLSEKGYDSKFGARPLKRAIQKHIEDPMAEIIIQAQLKEGAAISVGFSKKKEELKIRIVK